MRETRPPAASASRAAAARGDERSSRPATAVRSASSCATPSTRGATWAAAARRRRPAVVGRVHPQPGGAEYVFAAFTGLFMLFVVDSFVLGRRIRKAVAERFPDSTERPGRLVWYGVSRSTMIRKWRFPKADPAITGRAAKTSG